MTQIKPYKLLMFTLFIRRPLYLITIVNSELTAWIHQKTGNSCTITLLIHKEAMCVQQIINNTRKLLSLRH